MSKSPSKVNKVFVTEVKTDKNTYQWKIKQFKYLYQQPTECLDTPSFSLGSKDKINWAIRLFPNGDSQENKGFLSLYLCWDLEDKHNGEISLSLINNKQEKQAEMSAYLETKKVVQNVARSGNWKACGFSRFIKREEVLNEANNFLTDGCLTINCEFVLYLECKQIEEEEKQRPMIILKSNILKKLFLEDRFSDVKLIASCGKILPAHKGVLAACSPVFEAMFTNDMLEQKTGNVKIDDGEYEVIKEMLNFIYTGNVEDLKSIVFELVKLANKYQITRLINLCKISLIDKTSVNNVLQIFTIADSYNMEDLKKHAIDFGSRHLKEVVNSDDFRSSMYPQAVQAILEAFGQQ